MGPFLGGFLVQAVSWRLIFVINLPLAVVVVVVSLRHVPESRDPGATGPVDVAGGALVTAALLGLTTALIEAPALGWGSGAVAGVLAGSCVLFALFVAREHRTASPMLPLSLFRVRQFSAVNAVTFVVYAALSGALFLLPVELQQVSGYSPLDSGVALLPLTVVLLALSSRSGALAARIGPRLQMSVGPVLVGAGMVLFRLVGPSGDYLTEVLPAVALLAVGLAVTVAPLTASALASAPAEHASLVSAVNNDVARAGGLIAVAVLPALSGLDGRSYLHPVLFSAGFHRAVVVAGAASAAGGVLAAVLVRNPGRRGAAATCGRRWCAVPSRRPPSWPPCPLGPGGRRPSPLRVAPAPGPRHPDGGRCPPARGGPGARQWRP